MSDSPNLNDLTPQAIADLKLPEPKHATSGEGDTVNDKFEGLDLTVLFDEQAKGASKLSILEICEEAEKDAKQRKVAAREMQAKVALEAILDGDDIVKIARALGLETDRPDKKHASSWDEQMSGKVGNRTVFTSYMLSNLGKLISKAFKEWDEDHA